MPKKTPKEKVLDAILEGFLGKYPDVTCAPLNELDVTALDKVLDRYESRAKARGHKEFGRLYEACSNLAKDTSYYAERSHELLKEYHESGDIYDTSKLKEALKCCETGLKGDGKRNKYYASRAARMREEFLGPLKPVLERFKKPAEMSKDEYVGKMIDEVFNGITLSYDAVFIESLQYFASDIREISGDRSVAGMFITALINNSPDNEFCFEREVCDIGYKLKDGKKIIIRNADGRAAGFVGYYMKGGSIVVEGDADIFVGSCMEGGEILVKGNAGLSLGETMRGGKITVEGSTGDGAGSFMEGGEIAIYGSTGRHLGQHMENGSITVKGDVKGDVGNCMRNGQIIVEGTAEVIGGIIENGGRITVGCMKNLKHILQSDCGTVEIRSLPSDIFSVLEPLPKYEAKGDSEKIVEALEKAGLLYRDYGRYIEKVRRNEVIMRLEEAERTYGKHLRADNEKHAEYIIRLFER